jgi:hypothetical protein
MKNFFSKKKLLTTVTLLLLIISLSSCSGKFHEFEDIFTESMFPLLCVISGSLILGVIAYSFFGISAKHDIFELDGKTHWLTTYKSTTPSSLHEALEYGLIIFGWIFPFMLGYIIFGLIVLITGKINIFLELLLFIACEYASFKVCFMMPKYVRKIYYVIVILASLGLVGIILYLIYVIGKVV